VPDPPPTPVPIWSGKLHVAIEGFCPGVDLAFVGDDVFAFNYNGSIVRLGEDGPVTVPALRRAVKDRLGYQPTPFVDLHGRGRDRLYASVVTEQGFGMADGLMRLDGARWTAVPGFGGDETIHAIVPWTDGRLLVEVSGPHDQLRVLDGRGGGPDTSALDRTCPDWSFNHPTVDRLGNLAIAWSCGLDARVAIWLAGETDPTTHLIAPETGPGPFAVVPDHRGAFFVAYRSTVVARADTGGVTMYELPAGGDSIQHFDVDPEGRPWLAYNEDVYRHMPDGWVKVPVPGIGFLAQFSGVAHGTPWIRRDGRMVLPGQPRGESEQIYTRDPDGRWFSVGRPHAAFKPDERFFIGSIHGGSKGTWMTAYGDSELAQPGGEPLPYTAILTTTPVRKTLRCADERGVPIEW